MRVDQFHGKREALNELGGGPHGGLGAHHVFMGLPLIDHGGLALDAGNFRAFFRRGACGMRILLRLIRGIVGNGISGNNLPVIQEEVFADHAPVPLLQDQGIVTARPVFCAVVQLYVI